MAASKPSGDEVPATSCSAPRHETIQGQYVALIPTEASHADELWQCVGGRDNAGLFDYMPYGPFDDMQALQDRVATLAQSKDPLFWTIRHLASGRLLGWLSLLRIDTANRVVEIGHIMYAPQLQRTTSATEAWYLLASKAFTEGYRRLEWKCNANNAASHRAALRFGHTFEGVFRKHMIVKGRNRDTAWYSIIDDDWPDRKAALQKWMDASNFEEDGRQKTGLAGLMTAST